MNATAKLISAVAVLTFTGAAGVALAHPHRHHYRHHYTHETRTKSQQTWQAVGACYPAIEGLASSKGILGLGSARARLAAKDDWETKAVAKYGPEYGQLRLARNAQWDCKKGAILLAKCVVTAEPCGARIRG